MHAVVRSRYASVTRPDDWLAFPVYSEPTLRASVEPTEKRSYVISIPKRGRLEKISRQPNHHYSARNERAGVAIRSLASYFISSSSLRVPYTSARKVGVIVNIFYIILNRCRARLASKWSEKSTRVRKFFQYLRIKNE